MRVMQHNEVTPVMKGRTVGARERFTLRTVLPLVAVGSGLAAAPVGALELGELTVESKLGQPLRASIAYALAPSELLSQTCVSVSAGQAPGGLPGIGKNTVRLTPSAIVITGDAAIREPMLGTRVTINCPYTPNISRDYMLFVDPAGVVEAQAAGAALPMARPQAEPQTASASGTAPRRASNDAPIGQAARYQVQPGDTLYGIVRRIENRSMGLWPAVNEVFEANPDAFVENDPNKLKAGSWLTLPSLDGTAPVVATTLPSAAPPAAEPPVVVQGELAETDTATPAATYEPAAFDQPVESPSEAVVALDHTADLEPGTVPNDDLSKARTETIDIPDTSLEGPVTPSSSPNVPTAIISTGSRSESTSTLMWLAGVGLGTIAALLLYGRRFRDRFRSTPVGPPESGAPDTPDGTAPAPETTDFFADYDITDDSPTEENYVLDADLEIGTGLTETGDVAFAQDFGFAAATDLDVELPLEPMARAAGPDTDIIPPLTRELDSILDSEVMPEDDDYDMSIIRDATKMTLPEDVTERDLQAVEVDAPEDEADDTHVTISKDVNYDLLEQDYEDELSATQALHIEIELAAASLAKDLDDAVADDNTAAAVEENGEFDIDFEIDDTNAMTINMSRADETAGMRVANDDEAAETGVAGGKADTGRS
jgi:hypothetical protein